MGAEERQRIYSRSIGANYEITRSKPRVLYDMELQAEYPLVWIILEFVWSTLDLTERADV